MTPTNEQPGPESGIDALAQEIRRVDGSHSLGAGALAEALWPYILSIRAPTPPVVPHEASGEFVCVARAWLHEVDADYWLLSDDAAPANRVDAQRTAKQRREEIERLLAAPSPPPARAIGGEHVAPVVQQGKWTLLDAGDEVKLGDEYWHNGRGWERVGQHGETLTFWKPEKQPIRRRITPVSSCDGFVLVPRELMERASAAIWDAHYGGGIAAGYAQAVTGEIRAAIGPSQVWPAYVPASYATTPPNDPRRGDEGATTDCMFDNADALIAFLDTLMDDGGQGGEKWSPAQAAIQGIRAYQADALWLRTSGEDDAR